MSAAPGNGKDPAASEATQLETAELADLLLSSTGEGIYGIDLNGCCTFANPACLELLGFESDAEVMGKNMHDLVHHTRPNGEPYPVTECQIYLALQIREGTHVDIENMWRIDGTCFPAEYWSFPMIHDGELVGCVVTFVDITARKQVEEALKESEELTRLLLRSTGEGIYGIDLNGCCTFANPACLELLGFESDAEVMGKNMHDLVHHTRPNGEPYPVTECQIYLALQIREGTHVDIENMWRIDGTCFPAEYWSFPMIRDGEMIGCVVTFVDITQRKLVEEELRQSEKMAAVGNLSAGLAHELNNPAAAAGRASGQLEGALLDLRSAAIDLARSSLDQGFWDSLTDWDRRLRERGQDGERLSTFEASELEEELMDWLDRNDVPESWEIAPLLVRAGVRENDLDEFTQCFSPETLTKAMTWLCRSSNADELAQTVAEGAARISTLVNAFKSYSYMDQSPIQTVDIHRGLEDTLTLLHGRLGTGVEVVRHYGEDLPAIEVRGSELNQVWTNVMTNAAEAVKDRGTITVTTRLDGEHILVEIIDDGPGIPEDIQGRVFDPFFTTKEVGAGPGLGLDVARRVVTTRLSGDIGLRSRPGETAFWIRLPLNGAVAD